MNEPELQESGERHARHRGDGLAGAALGWLAEVLRTEFAAAPDFTRQAAVCARVTPLGDAAAPGDAVDDARWLREWKRRWQRFQLADRLYLYDAELERARTPEEVYRLLSEHAVGIVGGFTCILYPPRGRADRVHPLPNPDLRVDTRRLSLPAPALFDTTGLIEARALADGRGPLVGLDPLFTEENAVSLAHARFGDGGVVLLVERRRKRVFEEEDWALLRTLCARAGAALERIRLLERTKLLTDADPLTGLTGPERLDDLLQHAWNAAQRGEPLAIAAFLIGSGTESGDPDADSVDSLFVRMAADVLRQEARTHGIAIRQSGKRFLLVLPGMDPRETDSLMVAIRGRLGRTPVRMGAAQFTADTPSAWELVERAVRSCTPAAG